MVVGLSNLVQAIITAAQGVATYIADFYRGTNQAKVLHNLQQTRKRGVWTNRDVGWTRFRQDAYNSGAAYLDFGVFVDNTGVETLLQQVGSVVQTLLIGDDGEALECSANANTGLIVVDVDGITANLTGHSVYVHELQVEKSITGDVVAGTQHTLTLASATSRAVTTGDHVSIRRDIITGLSTTAQPTMTPFMASAAGSTPITIYTNGVQRTPKRITSIAASADFFLNGSAGPAFGPTAAPMPVKTYDVPVFNLQFYDRMVYFGFTDSASTGTSRDVLICNSGTYNTVTQSAPIVATDGGIFQIPPRLGPFVGGYSLRLNNTENDEVLIIGCKRGVAIITGSDATSFAMKVLTREYGILSNRAWIPVQNDLFFPSVNGWRRFSSLIENSTLLNSTTTFDLHDYIQRINQRGAYKIHAVHNLPTQEVQIWLPLDQESDALADVQNEHALIMNYNSGQQEQGPAVVNPIWSTKGGTTTACSIFFKGKVFCGGYDGLLQVHYDGNLYDTVPAEWEYNSPLLSAGDPASGQSIRKYVIITEGDAQKFTATNFVYERMDNNSTRRQASKSGFPLSAPVSSSTTLDSWKLGESAFPGVYLKLLEFEPEVAGRYHELYLNGKASDDFIDFVGFEAIYSKGGMRS